MTLLEVKYLRQCLSLNRRKWISVADRVREILERKYPWDTTDIADEWTQFASTVWQRAQQKVEQLLSGDHYALWRQEMPIAGTEASERANSAARG